MHFFLLLIFPFFSLADAKLSDSPKWLKLLHYKKNLFKHYQSEADGSSFFLHPNGKTDPEAELKRTIEVFSETLAPAEEHAICRFPLRYRWLNAQLGFPWKANLDGCKSLAQYRSKVSAKKVSLVFSSYHLQSPSSAFGHTFLRLDKYEDNETEMLDYGVSYAANASEKNPLLYILKGLFGGFKGEFSVLPYYYKVREYSDFEHRDLWSFELQLSQDEIEDLIDHIWELQQAGFDYFYFDENCSYHLLALLEVARPGLELTAHFNYFAIPADTVRLLHTKSLLKIGKRRESMYSRLKRLGGGLTEKEVELARKLAQKPELALLELDHLENLKASKILDFSLEVFDYQNSSAIVKKQSELARKKAPLLLARAKNPIITHQELLSDRLTSPAEGHSPVRLGLGQRYETKHGKGTRFEIRLAMHDLLDPPAGAIENAGLEIGKISVILTEKNYRTQSLILDEIILFNIQNYPGVEKWSSPLSWEMKMGAKNLKNQDCLNCPAALATFGVGMTKKFFQDKLLFALLFAHEIVGQNFLKNGYRYGVGPKVYSRFISSDNLLMALTSQYHFQTFGVQTPLSETLWRNEFEIRRHLTDRFSLTGQIEVLQGSGQTTSSAEIGLQYFYE